MTEEQKAAMQQLCNMMSDLIATQPPSFRDALLGKAQKLIDAISPPENKEQG